MRNTLTVTAKGQVTLRKQVLDHLGVAPGDQIVIDFLPSGRAEIRAVSNTKPISRLFGSLHRDSTVPLTIQEINEIIADGWAGIPE